MKNWILLIVGSAFVASCSTYTQTTSGKAYLARYSPEVLAQINQQNQNKSIDSQVYQIANVEPELVFPARIGIARIHRRSLTSIPKAELQAWSEMTEKLGDSFGQFIPVSPLIAKMVRPDNIKNNDNNVINDIRRGAARQHLDYVLAYEVISTSSTTSNALSITDISIIGLFTLPSRNIKTEATASAIFLDVRNGYPYGTASGFADKAAIARMLYSESKSENLTDKAQLASVINLGEEVEIMFQQLLVELASKS